MELQVGETFKTRNSALKQYELIVTSFRFPPSVTENILIGTAACFPDSTAVLTKFSP